jgi:hypothetical protein
VDADPRTGGRDPARGRLARFQFGDVATLLMTETRLTARTTSWTTAVDLPGPTASPTSPPSPPSWKDPDRRMMGQGQEQWLAREVDASVKAGTAWQVLGNQVVMARVAARPEGDHGRRGLCRLLAKLPDYVAKPSSSRGPVPGSACPRNLDAWDGYPADRQPGSTTSSRPPRPGRSCWPATATPSGPTSCGTTRASPRGGRVRRHLGDLARLWRLPARRADRPGLRPAQQGGEVHRPAPRASCC